MSLVWSLRLADIDTPELKGDEREEGLKARDFVRNIFDGADEIVIKSKKVGKYGRFIAEVHTIVRKDTNLNELLVKEGMAVRVNY